MEQLLFDSGGPSQCEAMCGRSMRGPLSYVKRHAILVAKSPLFEVWLGPLCERSGGHDEPYTPGVPCLGRVRGNGMPSSYADAREVHTSHPSCCHGRRRHHGCRVTSPGHRRRGADESDNFSECKTGFYLGRAMQLEVIYMLLIEKETMRED
ncbi:hypothetical protein B5X24_HaOG210666 [Helicoverpa armigera]|nr:hypothetical protein B5X24_HaOG210666 [Helicoverpa armigera]